MGRNEFQANHFVANPSKYKMKEKKCTSRRKVKSAK